MLQLNSLTFIKKINFPTLFISTLFSSALMSTQLNAAECRVDTVKLNSIKQIQPSLAIDSYGREVISTLITSAVTESAALTKLIGYSVKSSSSLTKLHNFQFLGTAVSHKAENKLFSKAVGDPIGTLIGEIDKSIDTQDDIIVRIGGVSMLPKESSALTYWGMTIDQVYPTSWGLTDNMAMPFIGKANIQIIEHDIGSKNDNLGDVDVFYVADSDCAYPEGTSCNDEVLTVFSNDYGHADNGAIYELDYQVLANTGDLNDIPERLLCNSSECFDANKPLNFTWDFTFPENKTCPSGYDEGAGFFYVRETDITNEIADAFRVCELIPHLATPASRIPCGKIYYTAEGYYDINSLNTVQNATSSSVTLKSNALSYYDGSSSYLSAQDGQYLGRCSDCLLPDSTTAIHVIDPNRSVAHWQMKKLSNGKFTLRSDNNLYLTYLSTGRHALALQDVAENDPSAQFTIENAVTDTFDSNYVISVEIDGEKRYLSACLDCDPSVGDKVGHRYSGSFHLTDRNSPFAVWEMSFTVPNYTIAKTISDNGDGVFDKDIVIKSNETWVVYSGDTMTLKPNRTLTIEYGGRLEVRGEFINEGYVDVIDSGSIKVTLGGKLSNKWVMYLKNQASFINEGTFINDGSLEILNFSVFANTIYGSIINNRIMKITGGALKNMGVIDNTLATTFKNDSKIYSSINNNTKDAIAKIFDPNGIYTGSGSNTNDIIDGYYLGRGAIGENTCELLGGSSSTFSSCTLNDYWLPYGKTLFVNKGYELILSGDFKSQGSINNNGSIVNVEGNINQCGYIDVNGSSDRGTILNPIQQCSETVDEALCSQYGGRFEFFQPNANNSCKISTNDSPQGVYEPLIISSGVSWYLEGSLNNFSAFHIEANAELIIRGGTIDNFSGYEGINNKGKISLEKSPDKELWGVIRNEGLINNLGIIDNYGDLIGAGTIQNICDGVYNVLPDWTTRKGPDAAHSYDLSGEEHKVQASLCYEFDTDNDGVADINDAFPYNNAESVDSDDDGVGDNADVFPNDHSETQDLDNDGVGDNADAFPSDPNESADSDGDGVGDNADDLPNNPLETIDSDSDGVGDNADVYPNDPNESADTDWDGVGDNADPYPNDRQNLRLISVTGNDGWVLKNARFTLARDETPWSTPQSNLSLPQEVVQFELSSGTPGSIAVIKIQYPVAFSPYFEWWHNIAGGDWQAFSGAIIDGDTVTLTFQDGGVDDTDGLADGIFSGLYQTLNVGGPGMIDTDRDGMADSYESSHNLDPTQDDSALDPDDDGLTNIEEFQLGTNPQSTDTDEDGITDNQDEQATTPLDTDGDGITDILDPEPTIALDTDGDGITDRLDPEPTIALDTDGDGITDRLDPEPMIALDTDGDGITDSLDPEPTIALDTDDDGITDSLDPEPTIALDTDGDGITDILDPEPTIALDTDGDGITDILDPEPTIALDTDGDGITDRLDPEPTIALDTDGDGITDRLDAEPTIALDTDGDGITDILDAEPTIALDTDGDGITDILDAEPTIALDTDGDGITDRLDPEPTIALDTDGDGITDILDPEPTIALDTDGDGITDIEDEFPLDGSESVDSDAVGNNADTDNDGYSDTAEIEAGTDPLDDASFPLDTEEPAPVTSENASPDPVATPEKKTSGGSISWLILLAGLGLFRRKASES